jgi:hypothetical protein
VTSDLLMAVNETVQPEHISLWLRPERAEDVAGSGLPTLG